MELGSSMKKKIPLVGDFLIKTERPVIVSNGIPCLQMGTIGSHSTPKREKEAKKDGKKGRCLYVRMKWLMIDIYLYKSNTFN